METIKINDKVLNVKNLKTLRSMMTFEQITKKQFSLETLTDTWLFYYIVLCTNNPDINLEWDEYIDFLEDNPSFINNMLNLQSKEDKRDGLLINEVEEKTEGGETKKKKRK